MGIPVEFSNALGCCTYSDEDYSSDLTDTENDEEYASTPMVLERFVPRSSKRTYGVFLDSGVVPERRLRSRINEQFEILRAVIPNSCTNEKASILTGAYEYIEQLQRQVQELHYELDEGSCCEEDESSCEDDDISPSNTEEECPLDSNVALELSCTNYCGCSSPSVEVVRTEEGFKIHIECDNRPCLLADIMNLLDSIGLNVEEASLAYQEHFVLDCIGSEVDGVDVAETRDVVNVCSEDVVARLKLIIADQ